ncbi:hypothetical protein ABZ897_09485 [Nonomuraea sp. NPDC046802]|uniref:hypothetical protein n=1 Tax=Nonomuraea sp. NPDC046802 TaxID=3154919 RepID=UPI0033D2A698
MFIEEGGMPPAAGLVAAVVLASGAGLVLGVLAAALSVPRKRSRRSAGRLWNGSRRACSAWP